MNYCKMITKTLHTSIERMCVYPEMPTVQCVFCWRMLVLLGRLVWFARDRTSRWHVELHVPLRPCAASPVMNVLHSCGNLLQLTSQY